MKRVKELLKGKGADVWSIGPNASVLEAVGVMAEKNIGALLVLDAGKVVGILSERDYARQIILKDRSSRDTTVAQIMSSRVVSVAPSKTVEECMALMTDKHIRHLPVLDNGELLGMVSIGDLVKTVIAEQRFVIEQLENYITGG